MVATCRRIRSMWRLSGPCWWTLTSFKRNDFCLLLLEVIWHLWEDFKNYNWWYREMVMSQLSDYQQLILVLICCFCLSNLAATQLFFDKKLELVMTCCFCLFCNGQTMDHPHCFIFEFVYRLFHSVWFASTWNSVSSTGLSWSLLSAL